MLARTCGQAAAETRGVGIIIAAAILCVIALGLLLTASDECPRARGLSFGFYTVESFCGELEAVGGDGRGAVKSIVIVGSFAVILTASWWLLGSTVPGIMVFIAGAAVWLWRWIGRRGHPA